MRHKLFLLTIISTLILFGCGGKGSSNQGNYNDDYGYKDGTHCAEIEYYYYKTETRSTYTLEVEIEDNELTKIYWPNGGWLDDSHFYPPDISDGYATFTSDRGIEYSVKIIGDEGDCFTDSYVKDIDRIERELEDEEDEDDDWYYNNYDDEEDDW